mmetsp:Transcript_10036/g.23210  ORF Transcript_10036/g.23210 Transcript_10036/m.23210 type:complete len:149 (-) Transcript_10036:652-1098(-)
MFQGASQFDQDISDWDVAKVEAMVSIGLLCTRNTHSWHTSCVLLAIMIISLAFSLHATQHSMFAGATRFNQDIGRWNVSQVSNMDNMFRNATRFKQNLCGWKLLENGMTCRFLFYGTSCLETSTTTKDCLQHESNNSNKTFCEPCLVE